MVAVTGPGMNSTAPTVEPLPDGTGYRLELSGKADLRVSYGRIEEGRYEEAGSVIVPPANEFFDDACITDHKSALGMFVIV